jgi:hypothetical protein
MFEKNLQSTAWRMKDLISVCKHLASNPLIAFQFKGHGLPFESYNV